MSPSKGEGHRGKVKDPESDGRLKENREAGRTKGATEASQERRESRGESESEQETRGGSKSEPRYKEKGGESADLKAREYRDEEGNIHHHTKTYMEQHKGEQASKK